MTTGETRRTFESFDRVARAAAAGLYAAAAVTALEGDTERVLAAVGATLPPVSGSSSLGALAAAAEGVVTLEDVGRDPRFARHPWMLESGAPIGAYAGLALRDSTGRPVGTLAVMGPSTRTFDDRDRDLLAALGPWATREWAWHDRERHALRAFVHDLLLPAAHDMRGALMSIGGFSDLLLQHAYPEAQRRELLVTVSEQAGRLNRVLDDFTELAHLEARGASEWHPRYAPVAPLVEHALREHGRRHPELAVRARLDEDLPPARIDVAALARALERLVACTAAIARPAPLDLALTRDPERGGLRLVLAATPGAGTGEMLERAFKPFARRGSALIDGEFPSGLAIVRRILELHGGAVTLEAGADRVAVAAWIPAAD